VVAWHVFVFVAALSCSTIIDHHYICCIRWMANMDDETMNEKWG